MARREHVTGGWLAVVAVAVVVAVATAACDDDDLPPGVEAQSVLEVETDEPVCLQVDENQDAEVKKLPVIDCAEPHSHEVFATATSNEEVFPGVDALEDFAEAKCLIAFEKFVGTSAFDSTLSYTWLLPTLDSWTQHDDHEVLCVLMNRDRSPLVGSMKDAQV